MGQHVPTGIHSSVAILTFSIRALGLMCKQRPCVANINTSFTETRKFILNFYATAYFMQCRSLSSQTAMYFPCCESF